MLSAKRVQQQNKNAKKCGFNILNAGLGVGWDLGGESRGKKEGPLLPKCCVRLRKKTADCADSWRNQGLGEF